MKLLQISIMKYCSKYILVARHRATKEETKSNRFSGREIISNSLFSFSSKLFFCSASEFTKNSTLHFLAQILCFFFFSRFCSSTSNRPLKHVLSTIFRPSKDAEGTRLKNIANKLLQSRVNVLRIKIPQLLPRPPTLQNVIPSRPWNFSTGKQ